MLVTSIGEKVEIDWMADNPLDTVVRTREMVATTKDINGNTYSIDVARLPEIRVGEIVKIEILEA